MVWFPVLIGTTDPNPQKTVSDFFASGLAPCLNSPGCEGKSLQVDGVAARIYNWKEREILIDLGFNWESGDNKSASGWVGQKGSWEKRDDVNEEWIMAIIRPKIQFPSLYLKPFPLRQHVATPTHVTKSQEQIAFWVGNGIMCAMRFLFGFLKS